MARIPFTGLIQITGESDSGKTSLALECGAAPERILFVDADVKGRSTIEQMMRDGFPIGKFYPWVTDTRGMKESKMYDYGMSIINSIKPGQYDALIWDTWTEFENTLHPHVKAKPQDFRENYSYEGKIKQSEYWLASFDYESDLIDRMLELVPLVIFTAHLKNYTVAGQRVEGKFVPHGKQPMVTKPRLRLWLRQNPDGRPVPTALVIKRIDKKIFKDGAIRTVNVLPRRLVPRKEDESLWDTINYYWDNPWGNEAQTLDEYELSILDGTLTEDQKIAMRMALLAAEEEAAQAQATLSGNIKPEQIRPEEDIIADIKLAIADGKDDNDTIKAEIKGATLPLIIRARKA